MSSGSSSGCSSGFSAELYQFHHQPDHRQQQQQQSNRTNNIASSGKTSSAAAFVPTHHHHIQQSSSSSDPQFAATSFYQQQQPSNNNRLITTTAAAAAGALTDAAGMLVSSGQLNNGHNNSSLLHRAQQQQQKTSLSHHHHNHHNGTATTANFAPSVNSEIPNGKSRNNNSIQSTTTGNFEPERPIGYGAFGVVWSVTDPRDHRRVALKKMPNVFQNLASCKRVFRELYMLSSFQHDNVLSLLDILQPTNPHFFSEIYILTELMQSDLHRIIVSPQPLSADHVKVFVYQILRGIKYLHSANVLHRDIKPGNLLVNSNCILKICDFGLARIWDRSEHTNMTHEVVTQYYRAPELLMGCRRYTAAVDVWSVGCIFAELLTRRILFQAHGPVEQLNMIIELLGTPTQEELRVLELNMCCDAALKHVLKSPHRFEAVKRFYDLIHITNHDSIPLLKQMLKFDPTKRITIDDALKDPYLDDGRMRFHSCMCTCCHFLNGARRDRVYCKMLEPVHCQPFDPVWEKQMARKSMFEFREILYDYITKRTPLYGTPLCINTAAPCYGEFVNSTVAQPSELPPSPNAWD